MRKPFRTVIVVFLMTTTLVAQGGSAKGFERRLPISAALQKDGRIYLEKLVSFQLACGYGSDEYNLEKCEKVLYKDEMNQVIGSIEEKIIVDVGPGKVSVGDLWYGRLLRLVKNAEVTFLKARQESILLHMQDSAHDVMRLGMPPTHSPNAATAGEKADSFEGPFKYCYDTAVEATNKGVVSKSQTEECQKKYLQ